MADLGGKLTAQVLSNFDHYWRNKREQDESGVSQSKKILKSDGIISFKTDSFDTISRKVRALSHQIPIKTIDLLLNKQVILEDILLDLPTVTDIIIYDKSIKAVLFPIKNHSIGVVGVRQFKIEGKSKIFSAGEFYSNYIKNQI